MDLTPEKTLVADHSGKIALSNCTESAASLPTLCPKITEIELIQMVFLLEALKLEIDGLKRPQSPSAYSMIKSEYGFNGSRQSVLDQLATYYHYQHRDFLEALKTTQSEG